MKKKNKIYFISDAHLGADTDFYTSIEREVHLVNWLDEITDSAQAIYLLGDIFDFWFEYRKSVPKGFTRFLGKISELCDKGTPVYFFPGNHDMWTFDYLEKETGVEVINKPKIINLNNKTFYLAHGDGLGPYDKKYNILKVIFRSRFLQFMFKLIHPDLGIKIAQLWSSSSRKNHKYPKNLEYSNEWLVKYSKTVLAEQHIDYFIFGHRHIAFQYKLNDNSVFTNLGDWTRNFTYAVFDGNDLKILEYGKPRSIK